MSDGILCSGSKGMGLGLGLGLGLRLELGLGRPFLCWCWRQAAGRREKGEEGDIQR